MKAIEWKNNRISPIEGFKRIFSVKGLVELAKSILKVVLLFGAGFYILYKETVNLKQLSTNCLYFVNVVPLRIKSPPYLSSLNKV